MAVDSGESPIPVLAATADRVGALGSIGQWAMSLTPLTWPAVLAFFVISFAALTRLP